MFVDINAPQRTYQVDDQPVFTVEVTNKDTTIPSRGVTVDVTFEQGLRPIKATQGYGRITDGVRFTIDSMAPQSQRLFQVQCQCTAAAPRACGQVAISDASGLAQSQQFCIQIMSQTPPKCKSLKRRDIRPPYANSRQGTMPAAQSRSGFSRIRVANAWRD